MKLSLEKRRIVPLVQLLAALLGCTAAVVALLSKESTLRLLLAGLCLGLLVHVLYYLLKLRPTHRALGGSRFQCARKKLTFTAVLPGGERRTLEVRRLLGRKKDDRGAPVQLNWITFMRGCHGLSSWVKRRVSPALYVGVNPAGIFMAKHIRARLGQGDTPVAGYHSLRAGLGENEPLELPVWPPSTSVPEGPILIVDSMFRTGQTAAELAERLRERYGNDVELWYVCLVGCGISPEDVEKARRQSHTPPGKPVPSERVFEMAAETSMHREQKRIPPAIQPHAIAYVSSGIIELPHALQ